MSVPVLRSCPIQTRYLAVVLRHPWAVRVYAAELELTGNVFPLLSFEAPAEGIPEIYNWPGQGFLLPKVELSLGVSCLG
jgi:hypothetical protein